MERSTRKESPNQDIDWNPEKLKDRFPLRQIPLELADAIVGDVVALNERCWGHLYEGDMVKPEKLVSLNRGDVTVELKEGLTVRVPKSLILGEEEGSRSKVNVRVPLVVVRDISGIVVKDEVKRVAFFD